MLSLLCVQSPGPAYYRVSDIKAYQENGPAYSIGKRVTRNVTSEDPGPADYGPLYVSMIENSND